MSEEKKLTKKQLKALNFRKSKDEKENDKKRKLEEEEQHKQEEEQKKKDVEEKKRVAAEQGVAVDENGEPVKKKRKTRRGKKGKGSGGSGGNRFILFVGNLPYDVTQTELHAHFSASVPKTIRIRDQKGIAFLEFEGDDIQKRMAAALGLHHSALRNRKINVELTVGGGGNSENRKQKIREKNEKLGDERKEKLEDKKKAKPQTVTPQGVHPSRANLIR